MRVLLDTNCLVALASTDHEHHPSTYVDFERRRAVLQRTRARAAAGVGSGRVYDRVIAERVRKGES